MMLRRSVNAKEVELESTLKQTLRACTAQPCRPGMLECAQIIGSFMRMCAGYWKFHAWRGCLLCPVGADCNVRGPSHTVRPMHEYSSVPVRRSVSAYTLQRFCQGGRDLPQANKDFWTPLNQTQLQSMADASSSYNDDFLLVDVTLFWQCEFGHCKGGANSSCEER
jgi:hypothetical protein